MKMWKRILLAFGVVLLLFVAGLAAAPLLFRDRIESRVKEGIDSKVDARVDFGDVGLGLFRHFPNLSFTLDDLTITGVDAFEGDTLAHVGRFGLVVDLGSAIRAWRHGDALVVRSVLVDRPYLHARVLEDGRESWGILKAAGEAAEVVAPEEGGEGVGAPGRPGITVAMRKLEVRNARLALDDDRTGLHVRVIGLRHELRGDLSQDRATLATTTHADSVTVRQGGIPYLTRASFDATADVDADMAHRRFTFGDNRVALAGLGLGFSGTAALADSGAVDLDLRFSSDRADFRDILSLVPAAFLKDVKSLRTAGTVAVKGFAKGRLAMAGTGAGGRGTTGAAGMQVPAFDVAVNVADGMFHYADLPLPVRDVFVDLAVANPGGSLDRTTVELSRFDLSVGDEPFHATLALATPVSDPEIRTSISGRLDLGSVARAVPLPGIDTLRGTVSADAAIHARRSDLDARRFDRVEARGAIEAHDVVATGEALRQPVAVQEARLVLSPASAEVTGFRARVGASDFAASGRLDNLLDFALGDGDLRGRATLNSRFIALDEWRSRDTTALRAIPVPPRVDLALSATVDSMTFGRLAMTGAHGAVSVKNRRATLDDFALKTLGGDVAMTGWYETTDPARPGFDFHFGLHGLDIATAAAALNTVRALAPAAQYATGQFSADLGMSGALTPEMTPVLNALNGSGTVTTEGIAVKGMPVLQKLADAVKVERLRDPSISDFTATVEIRDGRLFVHPFDLRLGPTALEVSGSNGVDGSLDYRLGLDLPRQELGSEANRVVEGLLAETGRLGVEVGQAETIRLDAVVGGTMKDPSVSVDLGKAIGNASADVRQQVETRAKEEAARAAAELRQKADSTRAAVEAEARARADSAKAAARAELEARADSIMRQAESKAARIRAEARKAAAAIREQGGASADSLEARATNPIARQAAKLAAGRLREEADRKADALVAEADRRAEEVLAEAKKQRDALSGG